MSENQNQQPPAGPQPGGRGVLITITESGRIQSQMMGQLNEAEFLGIGAYLSNVLIKDGLVSLSRAQIDEMRALERIAEAMDMMRRDETKEESCGTELCSDSSPSQGSGQSSESCPKPSEG